MQCREPVAATKCLASAAIITSTNRRTSAILMSRLTSEPLAAVTNVAV
ncbi:MAG: hypothetical protein IH831_02110 [Planctomycetes bacterium]|nr:hypothetical protein [Planctomycetota bacterium]